MPKEVNHRLAAVRAAAGLTPAQLAKLVTEKTGQAFTRQTVHKLETGGQQLSLRHLYIFADVIGVTPAAFLLDGDLSDDEAKLLRGVRALSTEGRALALRLVLALAMNAEEVALLDLVRRLRPEDRSTLVAMSAALEGRSGDGD